MPVADDAARMFRNEQKRHATALVHALDAIVDSAQIVRSEYERGAPIAGDLRSLLNDVVRAFERASALDALNEVQYVLDDAPEAKP